MLVPTAVSQVIYQKLAHMYGQGKNMAELIRYSSMPLLLLTGIMIAGISILSIILPYLVEFLLPNYAEGIDAVRWMIWDMVIYSALQTRLIFFLFKKQSYYLSSIVFGYGGSWGGLVVFPSGPSRVGDLPANHASWTSGEPCLVFGSALRSSAEGTEGFQRVRPVLSFTFCLPSWN